MSQQGLSKRLFRRGSGSWLATGFRHRRGPALGDPTVAGDFRQALRAGINAVPSGQAEAAYAKMVEVTPVYAEYKHRTDRAIRVFRLTPVSAVGE